MTEENLPASTNSKSSQETDVLETVTKGVAFVGVALYVIGLFVTNLYLRKFGFADYSLLRTRYVLTGATTLIFLVVVGGIGSILINLAVALILYFFKLLPKTSSRFRYEPVVYKSMATNLAIMLAVLVIAVALVGSLMGVDWAISSETLSAFTLPATGATLLFFVGQLYALQAIPRFSMFTKRPNDPISALSWERLQLWKWLVGPFFIVAFLLSFLNDYSTRIYPLLPEQWGGGQARQVKFVVDAGNLTEARSLGLIADEETLLTPAYPLVWESETQYLVRPFGQFGLFGASQVDKQMISGVISSVEGLPDDDLKFVYGDFDLSAGSATPQAATPVVPGS